MRITEIIVEAGIIDAVKAAQKNYAQAHKKGFDAVDRVLRPSRWGSDSDQNTDTVDIKDAVDKAATGRRTYEDDSQALQTAIKMIKAGKIETKLDTEQLVLILKAAAEQKPLNDQQRAVLAQFSKEI